MNNSIKAQLKIIITFTIYCVDIWEKFLYNILCIIICILGGNVLDCKQFFEHIKDKKIALCGIGVSNTPLIMDFLNKGAKVYACDRRNREQLGEIADKIEKAGAKLRLGEDYLDNLEVDIIFRTPGMNWNLEGLEAARKKGIAVTSEMEVFFDLCPATIFAVTGSDGKTTTTTLISKMLEAEGKKVFVGGNIGNPLLPERLSIHRWTADSLQRKHQLIQER